MALSEMPMPKKPMMEGEMEMEGEEMEGEDMAPAVDLAAVSDDDILAEAKKRGLI